MGKQPLLYTHSKTMPESPLTLSPPKMQIDTYRFYSVERQTILLVNWEAFGSERVKEPNAQCFQYVFEVGDWESIKNRQLWKRVPKA